MRARARAQGRLFGEHAQALLAAVLHRRGGGVKGHNL